MDKQYKHSCFAENSLFKNGCSKLSESFCDNGKHYSNCPFYKTEEQFNQDKAKAEERNRR